MTMGKPGRMPWPRYPALKQLLLSKLVITLIDFTSLKGNKQNKDYKDKMIHFALFFPLRNVF